MPSAFSDTPAEMLPAVQALRIGQQHYTDGRLDEAILAFRHGLERAGADADVATISDLHANLGNAYMLRGLLDPAGASYKAALTLSPHLAGCWCNLATIHLRTGRAQDAITLYLEALSLLGVGADEAVVFEDSPNGVRAAKAAGIFTVAVPNEVTRELGLDAAGADLLLDSLADLPPEELLSRLAAA